MKNWYLLVHWDSIFVNGFLAFNQPDKESARKAVLYNLIFKKKMLIEQYNIAKARDQQPDEREINRVKAFIKAINHPWRHSKEVFAHPSSPTIRYIELTNDVIEAGYWLEELCSGTHYCNLKRYRPQDPEALKAV
jgi:hypothetical protein